MKTFKRILLVVLILTVLIIIFRGVLFRGIVTYKTIGTRTAYSVTNQKLINYIDSNVQNRQNPDINDIVNISLSLTSKKLNFKFSNNPNDPNVLINSHNAHCVGYAAFFSTVCSYLLQKYKLSNNWQVKHHIAHIYVFGTNIHPYFDSPFFRDHDFVTIQNTQTNQTISVDPTIHDYFCIKRIHTKF